MRLASAAAAVATLGCTSTTACPAIAIPAIRAELHGLTTVECDAARTAFRDGSGWAEEVAARGGSARCWVEGGLERTGTFSVVVRVPGRPEHSFSNVAVPVDADCGGPVTQNLAVDY